MMSWEFAVLPGSARPDGAVEWVLGLSLDDIAIAVVPDWLADLMIQSADKYRTERSKRR